ncbi:MAG: DUF2169 domain-containing protein [Polyangiaceae bacterium]
MLEEVPGHVQVVAVGASAAETVCWRMRGELRVTVIVKGCFELVADAPMRVLEPEEMLSAEVHHGRNPSRSVCLTSDLSPYLPKADVVLTGHACAPEGQTIEGIRVRLAVFGERPLLDKSILVYGDTSKTGTRQFDRIPLVYERAYGGIGVADNPFGCGADGGAKMPNLVHPQDAGQVACFGPIGRSWPNRRKLLKNIDRKALEGPILEIPNGFDFAYFQAAPADQQIGHLQGNEWLVLEGMHPRAMQITSCLPAAIARARVYGLGPGPGRSLALAADLLRVDADSLSCQVVWRGSFPLSDASLLDAITIHAGIESAESPIVWPEAPEPRTPSIAAAPAPVAPPARGSSPGSAAAPPAPPSYRGGQPPAAPPGPRDSHPEASGAPSTRRRTPASWDTTMEIPPDLEAQVRSPAVPFRDGPADLAPSPASSRPQKRPLATSAAPSCSTKAASTRSRRPRRSARRAPPGRARSASPPLPASTPRRPAPRSPRPARAGPAKPRCRHFIDSSVRPRRAPARRACPRRAPARRACPRRAPASRDPSRRAPASRDPSHRAPANRAPASRDPSRRALPCRASAR